MSEEKLLEEFFKDLQSALRKLLERSWPSTKLEDLSSVAAVDAAYRSDFMAVAAVEWDLAEDKLSKEVVFTCRPPYPYIPGLLFLREGPPMLRALKMLNGSWDLLLVDAHGILHPRRMGLAVFLGLILDKPTIGVAKSLLVGSEGRGEEFGEVKVGEETLGYWFKFKGSRKFYASPGYLVTVEQIPVLIDKLGRTYPKALAYADKLSKKVVREGQLTS